MKPGNAPSTKATGDAVNFWKKHSISSNKEAENSTLKKLFMSDKEIDDENKKRYKVAKKSGWVEPIPKNTDPKYNL